MKDERIGKLYFYTGYDGMVSVGICSVNDHIIRDDTFKSSLSLVQLTKGAPIITVPPMWFQKETPFEITFDRRKPH